MHLNAKLADALQSDPALAAWWEQRAKSFWNFIPRPDDPVNFDQQHSFCFNRDPVSFLIGGNAAGTTEAAAFKTALFLLRQQPPPRHNTPFWIISNTYDQTMGVVWSEKLHGHGHIPDCEVQWEKIRWYDTVRGWPFAVPLKPWPVERGGHPDRNWLIEFKSYEQGRAALQARSIGGFFFSEQFPLDLFIETLRGCREYMFPGGQFAEFTPIEPELSLWVERIMDDPKIHDSGWRFYRANTERNRANLADGWFEQFFATVPDEMLATRMTGQLARFEGAIYQSFEPSIHVVDDDAITFPRGVSYGMGTDWGASEEHPHATVFGYRDGIGSYYIFDEYWNPSQSAITADHCQAIVAKAASYGWPTREIGDGRGGRITALVSGGWYGLNYADPSRPGEINEFNVRGITTHPSANTVLKGIDCVRSMLKPKPPRGLPSLFIHKRCVHLIEEMRKYRWMRGRKPTSGTYLNPKVAKPIPLKRDDDTVDALRYFVYSTERGRGAAPGSADYREFAKRRSVQLDRNSGKVRGGNDAVVAELAKRSGWFNP